MKPRSELPRDDVSEAKRKFLAAAIPLNPELLVTKRPLTSVGASLALGVIVGVMADTSFFKLFTTGWASKVAAVGMDLFQQHGLSAIRAATSPQGVSNPGDSNSVG